MNVKIIKKVLLLLTTLVCIVFIFVGCSAQDDTLDDADCMVTDNIVYWDDVNYKVNPVLGSEESIDYVDVSEKNGVTCVEFGWIHFRMMTAKDTKTYY